jgi:bifunctional non-homologous end joining protein LigD
MFKHACSGLEGVVSKVRDSRYVSGRSNDWVKETCAQRETLQNAGFAMKENKFDGLYVGRQKGRDLIYAGKVDLGFDSASAKELQARLPPGNWEFGARTARREQQCRTDKLSNKS